MKPKNKKPQIARGRPSKNSLVWPVFDSMAQAAAAMGGKCFPILKEAKRSGCRAFRSNRVFIAELLPWHFERLMEANILPTGFASWNDVLASERAKREKVKRSKEEGTALDLDDASRAAVDAEAYYFAEIERIERELPSTLEGLKADRIAELIKAFTKDLRLKSRTKFQAVAEPKK